MTANVMTHAARMPAATRYWSVTTSLCGCGGTGCASCQGQAYARPRFFAGQLLTEDDLQSLNDYVVTKNRLHASHLFGPGVVCGLEVKYDPCGGGKVIVAPGYALDCCGNDIVVSCPQPLDINVMVRDLLLKLRGGYDCGDPCAATTPGSAIVAAPKTPHAPDPMHRYCLYIDYCEHQTDPVSPYAVGEPCTPLSCEPTRVREGFRFELRCPPQDDSVPAICDRLRACFGDPVAAERTGTDAQFLRGYGARIRRAVKAIRASPEPTVPENYWELLDRDTKRLKQVVTERMDDKTEEIALDPVLDAILMLAGDLARFWVQPDPQFGPNRDMLGGAMEELDLACGRITPPLMEAARMATLRRTETAALLEVSRQLVEESRHRLGRAGAAAALAEITPARHLTLRFLAEYVVFNREILATSTNALSAMRDWLIIHLERSQANTRGKLMREVASSEAPAVRAEISREQAEAVGKTTEVLCRAVRSVLKDCICNALNPPCPSCDDTGVLLACLTVEDCEVEDICNLERQFVITGPSIRYWIPELTWWGEALEKWCCPQDDCEDADDQDQDDYGRSFFQRTFGRTSPEAELALSAIFGACPSLERAIGERFGQVSPARLFARPLAAATSEPPLAQGVNQAVNQVRAEVREALEALRAELQGLREENTRLEARLPAPQQAARRPKTQEEAP